MQWSQELLLVAYKVGLKVYIGIYNQKEGLKSRVRLECSEITSFEVVNKIICTCEDGVIKLYQVPNIENHEDDIQMVPVQELKISDKIRFNLARIMPFGEFNMIAASDYLSNIFIFKDGKLFKTYLNAHSKLITDLAWIFIYDTALFEDSKSESNSILP